MQGSSFARNTLPITLLSIGAFTVAGLIAGYLVEPITDTAMSWILFVVMCIVAAADLFVLRLVLDAMFAAAPARIASSEATLPQTVDSACALVMTFSTAGAVYGLIVAIMSGNGWFALPLGVISIVTCALTYARVQEAAQRLQRESAALGTAA